MIDLVTAGYTLLPVNKIQARQARLLSMLHVQKELDVQTVSDELEVSAATVRRMFARLESENKVIRIHGGVRIAPEFSHDYSYLESQQRMVEEKKAIGAVAARMLRNQEAVFLDSGSTLIRLAEAIVVLVNEEALSDITILTTSLDIANVAGRNCRVILAGGEVRLDRRDVCGPVAERTLTQFRVERAFFGVDGIDLEAGFMTTDERTASLNEVMIHRAGQRYVLADSTKFDRSSFVTYGRLEEVDEVLTDQGLDDRLMARFSEKGLRIRRVVQLNPSARPRACPG